MGLFLEDIPAGSNKYDVLRAIDNIITLSYVLFIILAPGKSLSLVQERHVIRTRLIERAEHKFLTQ